ncbi:MAG: glycosyltransferase family 4 protein [Thermodesulfobacteriota bacterium]|nr:glycosyltransferase family 4 protein [Thermodesulfobacteriota bacterium]
MKILHINASLSGGGAEQYMTQLIHKLEGRGIDSILVCGATDGETGPLEASQIYHVPGISALACQNEGERLAQLKGIIEEERPHLIFFHQVFNANAVKLCTTMKPSVKYVHDFKMVCPDGKKMLKSKKRPCRFPLGYACQIRAYYYRCMPRHPAKGLPLISACNNIVRSHQKRTHMIVASAFMGDTLVYNGFTEDRIHTIPYFTELPSLNDGWGTGKVPTILCLGRITKEKGMHYLLRAFMRIGPKARLIIVGDGPALNDIKILATKLGIESRVSLPGWLSHEKLGRLYHDCTLVVVPSVWPEPFGIVGIEAMAHEKPVVAFDVGGVSQWLKHGKTGFLVPPCDEEGLAERIDHLLARRDLAREMGAKGRALVEEHFAPEVHLQAILSLFDRALKEPICP